MLLEYKNNKMLKSNYSRDKINTHIRINYHGRLFTAYINTLKVFETLRSVFDENRQPGLLKQSKLRWKQAMQLYLKKLPQRKISPRQKRKLSSGCLYSGLDNSLPLLAS